MRGAILIAGLAACADPSRPPVEFHVRVGGIPAQVDLVTLDSEPHEVIEEQGIRRVEVSRTYDDYASAKAIVHTFVFYAGSDVLATGMAAAGSCERSCIFPVCPSVDEIELERITIPFGDFNVGDFDCIMCVGGSKGGGGCH